MPNVVSENERERLLAVSTALAAGAQSTRRDAGPEALPDGVLADEHSVRLHVPKTLAASDVALCDDILIRMLRFVDAQLPCLGSYLFASPALCDLHAECALEFSANEPAINVYYENGCFNPHKDYCALTVLIPLSSPDDGSFAGGGTGFWAPEERRARDGEPSIVLAPPAGTAMLFGGHVTHAGLPVHAGTRVVFVASFTRKFEEYDEHEHES